MTAKPTQQLGYFSFADDYSLMPFCRVFNIYICRQNVAVVCLTCFKILDVSYFLGLIF
jgi:hypothetical protein